MKADLYTLINRFKVYRLEFIAHILGIQAKLDNTKSEDNWEQLLAFFWENKTDKQQVEQLERLYTGLISTQSILLERKESGEADLTDGIKDLEHQLDQIVEILNKIKS